MRTSGSQFAGDAFAKTLGSSGHQGNFAVQAFALALRTGWSGNKGTDAIDHDTVDRPV